MDLYAALTFWLLVIVFTAWGVHHLWSGLIKPRVVNSVLLPGTLVAQLGYVLGLLLSGNSVQNAKLMGDDERGAPEADTPEQPRLPIIGPILVGLLPLVACAGCLYLVAHFWGAGVLGPRGPQDPLLSVTQTLPMSGPGFWNLLRHSITLVEGVVTAILQSDLPNWPTALFLYLAVCLTVRMAPFADNRRGTIGAIFLAALIIAIVASLVPAARDVVLSSWPILSFAVGMLLFLLLVSLVVAGTVGLIRILATNR
ncbi:MAG: hypothetical protein IPM18_15720 [Phycisphaerales bacterium]|nr:hypothetical protein [Phycisphaerales bacterium]